MNARGEVENARKVFEELIHTDLRKFGETHVMTLVAQGNLAAVLSNLGRQYEACEIYERLLPLAR